MGITHQFPVMNPGSIHLYFIDKHFKMFLFFIQHVLFFRHNNSLSTYVFTLSISIYLSIYMYKIFLNKTGDYMTLIHALLSKLLCGYVFMTYLFRLINIAYNFYIQTISEFTLFILYFNFSAYLG